MASRTDRLAKYFNLVLSGKRPVGTVENFTLLLEAIVEKKNDRAACVERIVASPAARHAIHAGIRLNTDPDFLNQHTAVFLQYLADPAVKTLCSGQHLRVLLGLVIEPRTVWNAFTTAFHAQRLTEPAVQALAWLMIECLITHAAATDGADLVSDARTVVDSGALLRSTAPETRAYGHKLQQVVELQASSMNTVFENADYGPGGRHDNDPVDYRQIAIYPTNDELFRSAAEKPFYRRADEILRLPVGKRAAGHLDNQFRLLREDMLADIREELQALKGRKKQRKRRKTVTTLNGLSLEGICNGTEKRMTPCGLVIACRQGLEALTARGDKEDRKALLKSDRGYLRHQSFGCLLRGGEEIVAFATVDRQVDYLLEDVPKIVLRIVGDEAVRKTLSYFKLYRDLAFVFVDTAVFAYEPILRRLQEKAELPLAEELLDYRHDSEIARAHTIDGRLVEGLDQGVRTLQDVLTTDKPISLDASQMQSFVSGLTQKISLIQGPPGTGKSFVGALIAKALFNHSKEAILVMCYTNHALDQFLEDLLDIGISSSAIVRLGSKSSQRTVSLKLSEQQTSSRRTPATWRILDEIKEQATDLRETLNGAAGNLFNFKINPDTILEYLEFEEPHYYEAFSPPFNPDGMTLVGEGGKAVTSHYLYSHWVQGKNYPTAIPNQLSEQANGVWRTSKDTRQAKLESWTKLLLEEQVTNIQSLMRRLDRCEARRAELWSEATREILRSKRIIGCTTTGAAMHARDLGAVSPGIVLLEEAGEILESHVLTALGSHTKQLIMIGDHQQLRPKINSYSLSVEKGSGYDLNRSLFERLVLSGFPHSTLAKQHRMVPEISSLVRRLTYPELQDGEKTLNRPAPRGLQDRVIFIDHRHPEGSLGGVADRNDSGGNASKQNPFEVQLVLSIVRYLGQQGYGTDKLVVLTPYLGQLHLLREELRKETDPILNDLDSYDLVRAGLITQASAQHSKRPIKLSTIVLANPLTDNYQGEESEIVIASLTRSNKNGDIGFMAAPQRLNVLLSRARDVLIMIANSNTFLSSKKGEGVWRPFVDQLQTSGHLYDGLPVKCEQHPKTLAVLQSPDDFDAKCPDGGCEQPCGTKLKCGLHDCPQKCHQLSDHSKMQCQAAIDWICPRNHKQITPCFQHKGQCRRCAEEDREAERRRQRDMDLDAKRQAKQQEYARQLALIQHEIAVERRLQQEKRDEEERQRVLQQTLDDLEQLKTRGAERKRDTSPTAVNADQASQKPETLPDRSKILSQTAAASSSRATTSPAGTQALSPSGQDWAYQKKYEGAQSKELDQLMGMIGLESIKAKFLNIKSQVDAAVRQDIDFHADRFGSVLLGNPGTGKTTVARIYAEFLTAMGIIPGSFIVETTGSRLANGGVSDCEKQLNKILNSDGGVLFIDEAYQLAQSNGPGSQVLDFLLAEIENLTGKVVVVLAGYRRQMEKFFAHNPGLPSRFPHEFVFEDYTEPELRRILEFQVNKKFRGKMKAEDGMDGLYCRIVARRIARQRGHEGFGNARTVENALARITARQAARLACERRNKTPGQPPIDDFLLTKNDLLGPEPKKALQDCSAWRKLQDMIGLAAVKNTVRALLDSMQANYERELKEKPLVEFTLNRVFLGSPGTGKTTVAQLYGQILVDLGYLSNGEVIVKNPADFIGSVIGGSEQNTKGILASTLGKVLVIDEAYGLFGGGTRDASGSNSNQFKTAVVDTIVAEVQSVPGDDRCVLLLGYEEQMKEMFQNVNPGLSRRFAIDDAFGFADFSDLELRQILDLKLKDQGFVTSDKGAKVAMEILARARNRPHFGNAGEIDILLNGAKLRQQQRRSAGIGNPSLEHLEPQDWDPEYDRGERNETNIRMLFQDTVGCDAIIEKLEDLRLTVKNLRELEMDPRQQVPFNFLFRGPPGTGKTSTARKMGQVYYDLGLLSSVEVVESSATDLIGQYIGQTGPKTQELLEKSLGKVLLIDEAYRLAEGQFAQEAMDEIVDCITKPKFFQKLIIILAGYDRDINRLMTINPGLTSRFPEELEFASLTPDACIQLLTKLLQQQKSDSSQKTTGFDLDALESPRAEFTKELRSRFTRLTQTANWANARDVQTISKSIFRAAIMTMRDKTIVICEEVISGEIDKMLSERTKRTANKFVSRNPTLDLLQSQGFGRQPVTPVLTTAINPPAASEDAAATKKEPAAPPATPAPEEIRLGAITRDDGVSDEVWEQLERDRQAAQVAEDRYKALLDAEREAEKAANDLPSDLPDAPARSSDPEVDAEAKKQREQRRLEELARRAKLDELRRKRELEEEARKKEQQIQRKLRSMGVCVAGYWWIKQEHGYRCAGGSHYISNEALGV
ncbi:putative nonsense-mediated mRNA decay protein [Aspergillus uvarum CBS 121591]|uniref:Putative nonsense-mediated mRNA decay protein n=1 Tax=Aspergillus uvarum CBS 121591 TaxID=1448315 RepID=A0A319DHX2_9EURO|nr:putative nonsense-mediated mRNA decay protein [Aspergillus uvarum CBS 121591]PYH79142.1 putative nonsense-mediated mRNA decay protein [Aspergillus uvarum CBS 121591]